jgi:exodeoxyribonuclease III
LLDLEVPVALIGDFNVMPTDLDLYKPERWLDDALFRPEVRRAYAAMLKQGWTDAIRTLYRDEPIYVFWKNWRNSFERDSVLRIDHFLLSPPLAIDLKSAGVGRWVQPLRKTSDHAPVWLEVD